MPGTARPADEAHQAALALTVLGSGSPYVHPTRASSGAVVWLAGEPLILVDAGGGTFERLGRLGVDPSRLEAVLCTHTHIDHSGGLAPVVFASVMGGRARPLTVVGPSGRDGQPGNERFCDLLFGPKGAWRYLHSFDGFGIDALEVPHDTAEPVGVSFGDAHPLTRRGAEVTAVGVSHGMMPAVAYRVDFAGHSVVVTGDLEGRSDALVRLARDCDVLVHDQALPRRDITHGHLHPPPEETGENAAAAHARTLVLTHLMPPAEQELDEVVRRVGARYDGRLEVASDLRTFVAG